MKRILFLLILNLIIFQSIRSQSWCPPGATWYPGVWSGLFGYDAIVEYKYTHDTLIQNKSCKIIKGTFIGQNLPDFNSWDYTVVPNYRTYYTYENNKTVYLLQNNNFDTVVNFNAQIGDKWRPLACPGGSSNVAFTITDTGHVMINNLNLKKVTASSTMAITNGTTTQTYTFTQTFTERIFAPFISWRDLFGRGCFDIPHTGEVNSWPQYCGYKDDEISTVSAVDGFCNKVTGISESSNENKLSSVFPNPSTGEFNLKLNEPAVLKIYDSTGSLVQEELANTSGNYRLNLKNLPKGIYHLKVQYSSEYKNYKLIIE